MASSRTLIPVGTAPWTLAVGLLLLLAPTAEAQSGRAASTTPPAWVIPQMGRAVGCETIVVSDVRAGVEIRDRVAATTLDITLNNRSGRPEQAVLLVPVPSDATVTGFAFEGPASEPTAKLLPRDEARRVYDSIVARQRDPALLEWAGWNMLRSSVFPVPAGGNQRVRISWESLLSGTHDRVDFVLPRSDLAGGPAWQIEVTILGRDVAAVYSPSHALLSQRTAATGPDGAARRVVTAKAESPGAFRLSVVRGQAPSVSVMSYPDPASGGGYFLLIAGTPDGPAGASLPREVTVVLDRSGSMAGAPFERAKAAVLRVLSDLGANDRANIIDFSNSVGRFAPAPLTLDASAASGLRDHVAALRPGGGTNIHDALLEALRQPAPPEGTVATVLFITDGVPTIGRTRERDIRDLVERGNGGGRRVVAIGLGDDLNAPLLDRISDATRSSATYLAMDDDLPARIGEVADRLRGPVLADLSISAADPSRLADIEPARLPDLFRSDSLVVLGRYRGEAPFTVTLEGRGAAGLHRLTAEVDPRQASTANAFVPRLWASRRIAQMVDEVRQLGLDGAAVAWNDPRVRELVGEIVRLSTTWGVLTEYTSMLALEGSNLGDLRALERGCRDALDHRAVQQRVGAAAVSQGDYYNRQKWASNLADARQSALAASPGTPGAAPPASAMNQCGDKTFYRQGRAWADASLAGAEVRVDEEVAWGSPRHQQLLWELVDEGRQSAIALDGEIILRHKGRTLRVCNDRTAP